MHSERLLCLKAEPYPPQHEISSVRGCWHTNLTLTWQPIVGVHPTGPYFLNNTGTPAERIQHGLYAQTNTFGSAPDLITFSSNLWDLGHWATATSTLLANRQIEARQLHEWTQHTSDILKRIEVSFAMVQAYPAGHLSLLCRTLRAFFRRLPAALQNFDDVGMTST